MATADGSTTHVPLLVTRGGDLRGEKTTLRTWSGLSGSTDPGESSPCAPGETEGGMEGVEGGVEGVEMRVGMMGTEEGVVVVAIEGRK